MSLVLEIEFLTGVCRAAKIPGINTPDWPPQPDRVFSALVSAWAARGEQPGERTALEWLEVQPPPLIHASEHSSRTAPDVYVPPNDAQQSKTEKTYRQVMPDRRRRQPRRFPVARPDDPIVLLIWPETPDPETFCALSRLASCIGYIGHSASLTRCRFLNQGAQVTKHDPVPARRRVYPGRLRELENAHHANPIRPMIRAGAPIVTDASSSSLSLNDWLVLEVVAGEVPDIRATPLVGRILRKSLMSGYQRIGWQDSIPELVSGHTPDGAPTKLPHLAIAPMAFAGHQHADGHVLGFAIIPPATTTLLQINGFLRAFETVARYVPEQEQRILTLDGSPLKGPLHLAPAHASSNRKWSLSPEPYLKPSRYWASATPIILERHLKRKNETELRELVARACDNAKLPIPKLNRIQVGKHSAINGMPAARPSTREPQWMRWKTPQSLASRPMIHAVIEFEQNVNGPVLLGAGRFTGLGLCRSLET